ncbi:YkvA family protein [Christiangramia crocea]|uniref:YkvA family protein n=1 Tax=Christiangramia crocea TaxID=2904124 RepID=UPI003C2BCBAB
MTPKNKLNYLDKFRNWAARLKKELKALRIAVIDNLVAWYVKALIILTVAYALSPVDLIPDFIPILGLLDDIIIVPLLIYVTVKLIPKETMEYCRQQAGTRQLSNRKNWIAGGLIILFWIAMAAWLGMRWMNE